MTTCPYDIAVCTAAIADWRPETKKNQKIKKPDTPKTNTPDSYSLTLVANPDILAELSHPSPLRPRLVIGFAAETENLIQHAQAKLHRKGCDWLIANDVSPIHQVMGGDRNKIFLLSRHDNKIEAWDTLPKTDIARRLVHHVLVHDSEWKQP